MSKIKKIGKFFLKKILFFILLIMSLAIGYFIVAILYSYLTDDYFGLSMLERQAKNFEKKYYIEKKDIFDVGTIISKEYIDIKFGDGTVEKKLSIKSDVEFTGWEFTNYDKSEHKFVVLSEEFSQLIKDADTFLITKQDYPYARNGWLISGKYICVNKKDTNLSCIGMSSSESYEVDEENSVVTHISFEFVM